MSSLTPEQLAVQIDRWVRDKYKGQRYRCGRGYANEHDEECACCLLIAARNVIKQPRMETRLSEIGIFDLMPPGEANE